jgi:hypothetical protein
VVVVVVVVVVAVVVAVVAVVSAGTVVVSVGTVDVVSVGTVSVEVVGVVAAGSVSDCVVVGAVEAGAGAGSFGCCEGSGALPERTVGAPPRSLSRCSVSAGRPPRTAASWEIPPCTVPRSPGCSGRYSPFG